MKAEEQRMTIAGIIPNVIQQRGTSSWFYFDGDGWVQCKDNDPLKDLNVIHEAEKMFPDTNFASRYNNELWKIVTSKMPNIRTDAHMFMFVHATASQRLEALIKVKGLWKE